ncbi:MAG: ThiJ/PfpI domain-containing protein [Candidatus Magasanikbacteria bacterium GW2011_GWC2_34_16]|uniref:ThiJ/PfpI domain-containing protein n=2 Tax=Candidatus Magasanikiibacteriota TaxID=1752731 RepID=A0A0G0HR94_9BACT|nr:MAG: ThiJ/PfpI domain-containing protein [Candidatus Magasanikbacteria bacterium GW2011_GWC2_34_16]KKQ41110.1 MAG: ThiJ/PfpI domain-containing protein [Candidatus Magasanikbacteria bacterium GW2011_GWA2_37_8]
MKKVLLVVASKDYQPIEYAIPKAILEAGGVTVITASNSLGKAVAIDNSETEVDILLDKVVAGDYDGIFFIGGPGALEYLDNEKSYKIIREVAASEKFWGAICISPRILANAQVLKGRKITGWDGDNKLEEILSAVNAGYVHKPVVVDNNLITASGPAAAKEFGEEILKKLS